MVEIELLHWAGGFILGAGAYHYYAKSKNQKPDLTMMLLAGLAGIAFVEFVLHGFLE